MMFQLNFNLRDQAPTQQLPTSTTTVGAFIGSILSGVMAIAALLVLLNLVWGAVEWISAGGDSSKIQKARDKITQSAIGLIVLASTVAIFVALQSFLGITVLDFGNSRGDAQQELNDLRGAGSGGGSSVLDGMPSTRL